MTAHSTPEVIRELLTATHTWAVVGCSPDPHRDSNRIARLLQSRGFRVIPVNLGAQDGQPGRAGDSRRALIPEPGRDPASEAVEVVDIFRPADRAGAYVDEAIEIGARGVWMQLGVIDEDAAERALRAGLRVVMNRCPAIELPRLAA